jgi:flavin reductase (DIM6/NTAB) family NADH-FMN oxidoreductase RutF
VARLDGGPPRRLRGEGGIEADVFRRVMGHFPTGVTVVAASDASGEPYGLTVNSFTSVSLDPPLVLVCIDQAANSHDRLLAADGFTVSVLAADQAGIAARFATTPSQQRFRDLTWEWSPRGDPVVKGSAAWLACTLRSWQRAGDHTILVAHVDALGDRDTDGLVFHRGRYGTVST